MKSHEEFLNENLAGEYMYYGPSSLVAIVKHLVQNEGKQESVVRPYLVSLGVPRVRINEVLAMFFPKGPMPSQVAESEVNEDDTADSLLSTDLEDELDSDSDPVETDSDGEEKKDDEKDKEEDEDSPDKMVDAMKDMADSKKKLDKIKAILKESRGASSLNESLKVHLQTYPDGSKSDSYVIIDKMSKRAKILSVHFAKGEEDLHDPMFTKGNFFDATEFTSAVE